MSFTKYPDLPAELRIEVRRPVLSGWRTDMNDRIAPLACVNKEWQFDVERILFSYLSLQPYPSDDEPDLRRFSDIVRGVRRSFVQTIWLDINPDGKEYFYNSHWYAVSCRSIHYLLRTLEKWGMPGPEKNMIGVCLYWGVLDGGGVWPVVPIVGSLDVSVPAGDYIVPLAPSSILGIGLKITVWVTTTVVTVPSH